jgi:hypothetical protein
VRSTNTAAKLSRRLRDSPLLAFAVSALSPAALRDVLKLHEALMSAPTEKTALASNALAPFSLRAVCEVAKPRPRCFPTRDSPPSNGSRNDRRAGR